MYSPRVKQQDAVPASLALPRLAHTTVCRLCHQTPPSRATRFARHLVPHHHPTCAYACQFLPHLPLGDAVTFADCQHPNVRTFARRLHYAGILFDQYTYGLGMPFVTFNGLMQLPSASAIPFSSTCAPTILPRVLRTSCVYFPVLCLLLVLLDYL